MASQVPPTISGLSRYLPGSWRGCSCPACGWMDANGCLAVGVPKVLPTEVHCSAAGCLWEAGRAALHLVEEEVQVVSEWWLP